MQMRHLMAGGLIVIGLGAAATRPGLAADPGPLPPDRPVRVTAGPTPQPEPVSTLAPLPTVPASPPASVGAPDAPLGAGPEPAPPPPARVASTPEPPATQAEVGVGGADASADPAAATSDSGAGAPAPRVLAATGRNSAFVVLGLASLVIGLAWVAVGRRPRLAPLGPDDRLDRLDRSSRSSGGQSASATWRGR